MDLLKTINSTFKIVFISLILNQTIIAQSLTDNVKEMTTWLTGEFDNFQQVWKEKEDKVADTLIHEHIHSIFQPISMVALGQNVFFVKQYMDGDTDKIYRMRIYSFAEDKAENAVRLDIFSFRNQDEEKKYKNAHLNPTVLKDFNRANLITTEGCAVYWKKSKDAYIGYMKDKACNVVSRRTGKRIFITDSLRLTPNELWIRDEAYDETGAYVFGHKGKVHHKLLRCRFYKGWIALRRDTSGVTEDKYDFNGKLSWHDQGKKLRFVHPDGTPSKYTVELSQVIYENAIPVLKLAIYEDGNTKALSYTWGAPDAKRIGINVRWMQIGLTAMDSGLPNSR
jgi:hypothetical protein